MNRFSINLPTSKNAQEVTQLENVHTMVIIGANGSGKTRLGHWIENNNQTNNCFVHRIAAQRMLEMDSSPFPMSIEDAKQDFLFGSTAKRKSKKDPKYGRWGSNPITRTLWDFDAVIGYLYAQEDKRNREYVSLAKKNKGRVPIPTSKFDVLQLEWNKLFPHRGIELDGNQFKTIANNGGKYLSSEMSDGERVVFYLLGQCLLAPENSIIVIDEPETHIHKSLQISLWDTIESLRNDCCFIYITHDLDFAAYRETPNKLWLKAFDGKNWEWEFIPHDNNLSEEILLEILGSRKPILFVEGEKNSYDHKIYQSIYSDYLVIPRGGCTKVIESTKSLQSLPLLQYIKANGIIDRDYRANEEIEALDKYGIKTINVAEVENLLCVEELIKYIATTQELDPNKIFTQVKRFIINEFKNELNSQVSRKTSFEVKYKLGMFEDTPKGVQHIDEQLQSLCNSINTNDIYETYHREFSSYISNNDYLSILKVFNRKSLPNRISKILGLADNMYPDLVMRYINSSHKNDIQNILKKYTPAL